MKPTTVPRGDSRPNASGSEEAAEEAADDGVVTAAAACGGGVWACTTAALPRPSASNKTNFFGSADNDLTTKLCISFSTYLQNTSTSHCTYPTPTMKTSPSLPFLL